MAKYSTDRGDGGGDSDSCEPRGRNTAKLWRTNVAGAGLLVCPDRAPHGGNHHADRESGSGDAPRDDSPGNRKKRATQRITKLCDSTKGDSKHWEEEGTNYEKDRFPYLISGYGDVIKSARQDAGLQLTEFVDELDLDEKQLPATEQDRVARAGVGELAIRALEERLDMTLVDE